jgi:hypothetical protein
MEKWGGTGGNYETLKTRINGLLPGATSAGLAEAFHVQKKTYRLFIWMWSVIFVLTVGGMIVFGVYFYEGQKETNFKNTLIEILARLPFFVPAVWLAIFAGKKQNQNTRLQQEYSYKESLARSYEANRREIDKLPDGKERTELLISHLSTMVTMLGYNPSATLENKSHTEKTPVQEIAEKVLAAIGVSKGEKN